MLDLGCGFGWFARWAAAEGAASVHGIDLSERMLEPALEPHPAITYERGDLGDHDFGEASYDVVHSSLTFHYIADLDDLFARVQRALVPGGQLVFTVEHPVFTAPRSLAMIDTPDGPAWPLNDYGVEGERTRSWLVDGVVKQHRTVATWVNSVIDAGFGIDRLIEFGPSDAELEAQPAFAVDRHRPPFLIVAATKQR